MKPDLRSLTFNELEKALESMGEPRFRAKQLFTWIQEKGSTSFDEMRNIPKELREKLNENFAINSLTTLEVLSSKDGTKKYLFGLPDGNKIESVLLEDEGRKTICISTQVGCRMKCAFCASARIRYKRNLTPGEIISQVIEIEKENGKISNLVFMGIGEPFDNYEKVLKSMRILMHPLGKNIGQRKITVSTCGLPMEIKLFAAEGLQVRLAVSLNATEGKERNRLMPINKKHRIRDVIEALKYYEKLSGRRATIEYLLINERNDSEEDAKRLVQLLKDLKANVNLITFNPFEGSYFASPDQKKIKVFKNILEAAKIEVSQRFRRGTDINAACGQLAGKGKK